MCAPVNLILTTLSVPAAPANFRDWPACMQRRYQEYALAGARGAGNAELSAPTAAVRKKKPTPDPVSTSRP